MGTKPPKKKQWATAKDWAAHRETISTLYRDMELEDLMEVMEQKHHFYSTARMYKTKIRDWGIGKRLRDEDIISILYLMGRCRDPNAGSDTAGPGHEFWVRGYRVNDDNVRRYLRRKPALLAQFRAGRVPQHKDLAHVRVAARDLPSPRDTSVAAFTNVKRSGSDANLAQDTEFLIFGCREYVEGAFRSGNWVVDEDGLCGSLAVERGRPEQANRMALDIQSNFYTASQSLERSQFSEAFKVLDLSFQSTRLAVAADVPRVLSMTLNALGLLQRRKQYDILNVFLRFLRSPSGCGGCGHRLGRVLEALGRIDQAAYDDVFELVFGLLIAEADRTLGPDSSLSFDIFWDYFGTLTVTRDLATQVDSVARQLAKVGMAGRDRPWVLRTERLLAWKVAQWKAATGDHVAARQALAVAEATLDRAPEEETARHYQFSGRIYDSMGDLATAEEYWTKAVRYNEDHRRDNEDGIQYGIVCLADVLERRGKPREAESLREYAISRLRSLTAKIDWDWNEFARRMAEEQKEQKNDDDDDEND